MRRSGLWWVGLLLVAISSVTLSYYLCQIPAESIETSRKYVGPVTLTGMSKHFHIAVNCLLLSVIAFVGFAAMRQSRNAPPPDGDAP
jgi:hypothetical protein